MARLAKIENGLVVNVILGGSVSGYIPAGGDVNIGWSCVDGVFAPPPLPEAPAPSTDPADWPLNRFQFEGMLLSMGVTFAQIETAIAAMETTDTEKAFAVSRLRNAVAYQRSHPLIASLMPAFGLTDAEVDAAWMTAKDIH